MSYIVIDGDTCEAVCPTGAVTIKDETDKAREIFQSDKETTRVVVEVAPAVRVALGEKFGMARGENAMGKIVAGLRTLGADIVADGAFAADFLVAREADELKERLETGENLPLFSSFCPAWVHYVQRKYPDLSAAFSSCLSPMRTFGESLKAHFDALGDGKETKVIAVMPCAAEKCEEIPSDGAPAVDLVLTTDELAEMFKKAELNLRLLAAEAPDEPFGHYTGAGILTGVSGGVAEAAARRLSDDKSEDARAKLRYSGIRGPKEIREAEISVGETRAKIAVVYGLKAAGELAEKIATGEAKYDFVEVTACPDGCVSGGGQPCLDVETEKLRAAGLYYVDQCCEITSPELNEEANKFFCPPAATETEEACESEECPVAEEISQAAETEETLVEEEAETAAAEEPYALAETAEEAEEELSAPNGDALSVNETEIELAAEDIAEDLAAEEEPLEELFEEEAVCEEPVSETEEAVSEEVVSSEKVIPEESASEENNAEETVSEEIAPEEGTLEETTAEAVMEEPVAQSEEEIALAETKSEISEEGEENASDGETENAEAEDVGAEDETDGEAEPYHKTLSRKERRKLKRMKKFRR